MPKGYWIPHLDVSSPQGFQAYRDTADAAHKRFGSKLLARAGRRELLEGTMRARNVLREFNSYDEAQAFYHGPEYSEAHPLREPHSVCDFLIIEGYDGPQPPPIGTQPAAGRLKGYWIAHIDVSDPAGYKAYQDDVSTPFGKFGGRYVVRGGRCEVMEGRMPARTVVVEFPSYGAALACYRSVEYQASIALRNGKAVANIVAIEAFDPAQQ